MGWYDILYTHNAAKKKSFPLRISSVNVTKSAISFIKEILNEKLHFLCSVSFCVV